MCLFDLIESNLTVFVGDSVQTGSVSNNERISNIKEMHKNRHTANIICDHKFLINSSILSQHLNSCYLLFAAAEFNLTFSYSTVISLNVDNMSDCSSSFR